MNGKPYAGKALVILMLSSILFLFISCSEDGPASPNYNGPDEFQYDVEYSDNTIILDQNQENSLLEYDTTSSSYFRFNEASYGAAPSVGQIIIIDGKAAGKVTSVENQGGELVVHTEPAKLNEIIKNGKISWDFIPDISNLGEAEVAGKKVKAEILNGGHEYKFTWAYNEYTIWMKSNGTTSNGLPEIQVNITMKNQSEEGKVYGIYGAKGTTRLARQSAEIEIKEGELNNYSNDNKGLRSELTLSYETTLSQNGGTFDLTMPNITMKIPLQSLTSIPIPIPIYIKFGIGFKTAIVIPSVTATAMASCKMILDSDTGFEYQGTKVGLKTKVNDQELGDLKDWLLGDNAIQPVGIEIKHEVSIPRVSIEILGQELAWASLVARSETKLMVPSLCKAAMVQVRIDGGYKFEVLGQTLAEGKKMIWEMNNTIKGPNCP